MNLSTYIKNQAATVGRRPKQTRPTPFIPEWPNASKDRLGSIKLETEEESGFVAVGLSPDDRKMVTGHGDGHVRCWDMESGEELWVGEQQHGERVIDVRFSPDGTRIATASSDKKINILDTFSGNCLRKYGGHKGDVPSVRWSLDGKRLASIERSKEKQLHIWDGLTGECLQVLEGHTANTNGLDWSPDGRRLASGDGDGNIRIWDAYKGDELHVFKVHKNPIWSLCWLPDGRYIISSNWSGYVIMIDALNGNVIKLFEVNKKEKRERDGATALDCSPDGRFVVAGFRGEERTIRVWDVQTGEERKCFAFEERYCTRLAWSSTGAFIVSSHDNDKYNYNYTYKNNYYESFHIWNIRDLMSEDTILNLSPSKDTPLPTTFIPLPFSLAQMIRLNIHTPLSLLQDLLLFMRHPKTDHPLAPLLKTGFRKLLDLRWPSEARIGFIALLLHEISFSDDFQSPKDCSSTKIRDAITTALKGEPIEPTPAPLPLVQLNRAAQKIDNRMISLLHMLGPDAVANDPGLPLRLLPEVKNLPPMTTEQRALLSMRVSFSGTSGKAIGNDPGADRGQVGGIEMGPLRSDWRSLLPSQYALPDIMLSYRHIRGELLFRARQIAEPPKLRPTVLLLDVSPPTFGPIEAITRLSAFAIARTLQQANIPCILITTGDTTSNRESIWPIEKSADLIHIWTHRSLKPAKPARSLKLANAIRANLRNSFGPDPAILLLTQPWFGEEENLPDIQGLRGLFVQYPSRQVQPFMAGVCERWESVDSGMKVGLEKVLGGLIG